LSSSAAALGSVPHRRKVFADLIEERFTDGAADGFNIMPPRLPSMLDVFNAEMIPLLQRRGLFRRAYED
jgi:alkanesulfonate monooxygenase SsuD/methylene tetrahydromethanopterin reductase-like flavin-dependent oxidoreductase (luciferase family)